MCGIVGYIGSRDAIGVLVSGLKRLEYRGYDSSGVAVAHPNKTLELEKATAKIVELEKKLKERDNLLYLLYKYRFKENLTSALIAEKTDLETPRVSEKIDKVAFSLRIYCGI